MIKVVLHDRVGLFAILATFRLVRFSSRFLLLVTLSRPRCRFFGRLPRRSRRFRDPSHPALFRDPSHPALFRDPSHPALFRDPGSTALFRDPGSTALIFLPPCAPHFTKTSTDFRLFLFFSRGRNQGPCLSFGRKTTLFFS